MLGRELEVSVLPDFPYGPRGSRVIFWFEPCNGMPDALDATARGTCVTLEGGGRKRWSLEVEISS
jgi:hypothetical protein